MKTKKLLLLGAGGSGKSTFFKQLRTIHGEGIKNSELEHTYKEIIFCNILGEMKKLLESAQDLNENNPELGCLPSTDLEQFVEFITNIDEDSFDQNRPKINKAIEALWKDEGVQKTWNNRHQYQIQDSAKYFFENIARITEPNYIPNDDDVLMCRIRTTGIVEQEFMVKKNRFQVYDVGGQRNERKKWIHCFEHVTGVIFIAALTSYNKKLFEDDKTNRMKEALGLFQDICNSRWFKQTAMILFLNKKDLFPEMIMRHPLTICFPEYQGDPYDELEAKEYIKKEFQKRNFPVKVKGGRSEPKQLFCHYTCAIDRNQMKTIFLDVQNVIIHQNLRKAALI